MGLNKLNKQDQSQVKEYFRIAKAEWEKHAYVQFSETASRDSNIDIHFEGTGTTRSDVGPQSNGKTNMYFLGTLANGRSQRNFLHELGHALGFDHEHERPDRSGQYSHYPMLNPDRLIAASALFDEESIMMQVLIFL